MSSRESRWAGGEGLRVGLMIAAVLLGPMLLRAVGLPPGVVLMLLFLVPMLMQGLGRFRRGGAGERGRDAGEQEAAGDLAGEDAGPAPRPTLGEALAPFRRGLSGAQLFGTGGFSPGIFGARSAGPGQIEAVYGKVTGRHRADLSPGMCLARLASVLDRDELYRLERLDEQGMNVTRRAALEVPDYPLEITVRPAIDDDGVDLERADVVIVSDPPTSITAQEQDAMRVIGQLFTILDVPAGPPRAAEGDAETPGGGAGPDG
ncbi:MULTISPECIES: hypothetical protein [Actinomycetes]|uniref:Uncharacterized protein n=1 Tax=Rothia kristinae TaxID=37923 RepID=A0A7T3CHD4_9MICC|nr:hypothetical protein [Rothia kristinae]MED6047209.1 hypothetical protein [Rothia kristinae]QPT54182.1 hypothetical protein I6G21_03055 [Rothia kristinae]TDP54669.1 hypothetical protein DEU33_1203 [Kocuria sp. AG109]